MTIEQLNRANALTKELSDLYGKRKFLKTNPKIKITGFSDRYYQDSNIHNIEYDPRSSANEIGRTRYPKCLGDLHRTITDIALSRINEKIKELEEEFEKL